MSEREIEPLAYRVRPMPGECFESWLDRLAARHESTRKALFGYLGIKTALADRDLASSAANASDPHKAMVARLAWATELPEKVLLRTFVCCPSDDLLPLALRFIGCAQCWLDWLEEGAPWRIERSWILRVALRCERHDLLLTDLGGIRALGRSAAARRQLEAMVVRTRAQMAQFTFIKTRLAWNSVISRAHIRGSGRNPYISKRYTAALVGNRFHFAPERHLLMAALHCGDVSRAERMEQIFRFDARPVREAVKRTPRGTPPALSDLVEAIGRLSRPRIDGKRDQLEATGQRLKRARQEYPAKHAAHLRRGQRAALERVARGRYAAELASASSWASAPLRGFQDALFYLKQCGMADDVLPTAIGSPDPWEDCLEDAEALRGRLAKRFTNSAFRIVLDLPVHTFSFDLSKRESD